MEWMDKLTASWARSAPGVDVSCLLPMAKLGRLSLLLQAFQDEQLAPHALTPGDYSVLAALRRSGAPFKLSPSELYNVLECSSGGMTKMLKRLEARGLVERSPDPSDGRSSQVSLTAEGKRFERKVFDALLAGTQLLLEPISASDLRAADRALEQLLGCFERHFYR